MGPISPGRSTANFHGVLLGDSFVPKLTRLCFSGDFLFLALKFFFFFFFFFFLKIRDSGRQIQVEGPLPLTGIIIHFWQFLVRQRKSGVFMLSRYWR